MKSTRNSTSDKTVIQNKMTTKSLLEFINELSKVTGYKVAGYIDIDI